MTDTIKMTKSLEVYKEVEIYLDGADNFRADHDKLQEYAYGTMKEAKEGIDTLGLKLFRVQAKSVDFLYYDLYAQDADEANTRAKNNIDAGNYTPDGDGYWEEMPNETVEIKEGDQQ